MCILGKNKHHRRSSQCKPKMGLGWPKKLIVTYQENLRQQQKTPQGDKQDYIIFLDIPVAN